MKSSALPHVSDVILYLSFPTPVPLLALSCMRLLWGVNKFIKREKFKKKKKSCREEGKVEVEVTS